MTKIYLVENCYGDKNKVYIGKTKNTRFSPHKRKFGDDIKYSYIDCTPSLLKQDWKPLECYWIEQFRQWGFELMNLNTGGGGCSFHTEDEKLKMRVPKINKENYSKPKTKNWKDSVKGKSKYYPESRNQNISNSLKGYKQSEEHILKRSSHLKGKSNLKNKKPKPEGFGENVSIKLKGKPKLYLQKSVLQYDLQGEFIKEWNSITEICTQLFNDVSKNPNITKCCQGKIKTAYGFIWKFKNHT
jgi:hypothetical protein